MKYSHMLCLALAMIGFISCNQAQDQSTAQQSAEMKAQKYDPPKGDNIGKVEKSEAEWKAELTEKEFYVLREAGTERAFTGDLVKNKEKGIYTCAGCGLPLFSSNTKFESGTGWPSFWEPIKPEYIIEKVDNAYGMSRTEVLCARCGGHQGHVFNDGPKPTGLRYCINAVSMDFVSKDKIKEP